jgi:hypothetical protein
MRQSSVGAALESFRPPCGIRDDENCGGRTKRDSWHVRLLCRWLSAASKAKKSYLSAQCRRLATRRGKKRALLATCAI